MSLGDEAIGAVEDHAEDWARKLLDSAADGVRDHVPDELQDGTLGIVLSLRGHEAAIGKAGALGFARLVTAAAAGDVSEAELEIDRARTWEERRVARRRARLAAHDERTNRDDALGMLLAVLEAAGEGLRIALPYLLAPALDEILP